MNAFIWLSSLFLLLNAFSGQRFTDASECIDVLRKLDGHIESPGFSSSQNYPKGIKCKWVIIGPTGSTVSLTFETFSLEKSKRCFYYDYVALEERCTGRSSLGKLGKEFYCGDDMPPSVNTTCNELHITFISDDSDTDIGFKAKYKINKDSEAPTIGWFGDSKSERVIEATAEEKFTFHCRVDGQPRPKRYWVRVDGVPLNPDAYDDNNGTLTITSLRFPEDSGEYMCVANNTFGEDRKTATLNVIPRCNCPKNITTNWVHSPPFVIYDPKMKEPTGIFPKLFAQLIPTCCGNCSQGHGTSTIFYSHPKVSLDEVKAAIASKAVVHMSFPINGKETDDEYKGEYYRPMFSSPGVAVLVMSEDPNESAKAMLQSVVSAWPVLLLTLVMAWLSGIAMWTLDTWYNPEEFPRPFHLGVFEGFWWAFVTMTTVGYGDRSPRGYAARVFAIVWVLVGLVVISITTGVITTSLTAITLSTDVKLYGAKMGALANTTEYRFGVKKNSDVLEFDSIPVMFSKLESRSMKGVYLDSFVAGANKGSMSSSIRVNKILSYDSSYGMVLRGKMGDTKLRSCFDNFVTSKKGIISKVVEDNTTPMKEPKVSASEEIASGLFDANTPLYKSALFSCIGMLLFFSACGLIWDYGYMRHFRKTDSEFDELALLAGPGYDTVKCNMELLDSLMQEVQDFNDEWSVHLEEITKRHEQEYRMFSDRQAKK